jgi:hypothetical protein
VRGGVSGSSARRALLVTLAALGAWPQAAGAYRPFDSTDAAVAAQGEAEVELGPVGWLRPGTEQFLVAPSLILNWGFADRWEAVLEGKQLFLMGSGVGGPRYQLVDTALNLKSVLREGSLQEKEGISIATEIGALLPTFHGDPGMGAQGALIASQRWQTMTVHLDGQIAWTRSHVPGFFGGLIVEGPDRWPVRPVAEVFVEGERSAPTTRSALLGAIWRLRDALSLDAGLRAARTGAEDSLEVRAGITWAFPVGVAR